MIDCHLLAMRKRKGYSSYREGGGPEYNIPYLHSDAGGGEKGFNNVRGRKGKALEKGACDIHSTSADKGGEGQLCIFGGKGEEALSHLLNWYAKEGGKK